MIQIPVSFFENFKSSLLSPLLHLLIRRMVMIDIFVRPLAINNRQTSLFSPPAAFLLATQFGPFLGSPIHKQCLTIYSTVYLL
jgi:hypothetical protein